MADTEKSPMEQLNEKYSYAKLEEAQIDTPPETKDGTEDTEDLTPEGRPEDKPTDTPDPSPSGLLDRAAKVGLGPGDAAAFTTPKDLEAAVRLLEGSQPPPEESKSTEDHFAAYKVEIDKEAMTEDAIVDALKGMAKHHADQTRKVVEYVQGAMHQSQQRDQGSDAMQWFDNKISGLGPEWESTFGKGPTSMLSPGSPELANRQKAMGTIGGVAQNRPDLTEDALFNMGVGEFNPKPPTPRETIARPRRSAQADDIEPFSKVKEMYAEMVRENGDQ